jgi:hypothetical protein
MKRKITMVALLVALFAASAMAQGHAIKFNPLGLLFGTVNLGYEHVLGEKNSFELGAAYANLNASVGTDPDASVTGFGVYAMYRMYIGKKMAPRGIYLAPNFSYNSASGDDGLGESASINLLVGGVLFGNQWVWGEDGGFLLDLGIGAAYYNASTDGNISDISLDGLGPQLRLAIGYAF